MNIYDEIRKAQEEQNEIVKSVMGLNNDIEKGKVAVTGEIRDWGGKKYKKQPNGKWLEVSESHGLTRKEHTKKSKGYDKHYDSAVKLSDKEHTDEEVGLGNEKDEYSGPMTDAFLAANKKVKETGNKEDKEFLDIYRGMPEHQLATAPKSVLERFKKIAEGEIKPPTLEEWDNLQVDDLFNEFPDKDSDIEKIWDKQKKILSKYLKKDPEDYISTGGGRSFATNTFDELKERKDFGEIYEKFKNSILPMISKLKRGSGKKEKIQKSITLKEVVIQNAEIQKSHINNIFEYNDQFKVTKKGSEVKEKLIEALKEETEEIQKYLLEATTIQNEIGVEPTQDIKSYYQYKIDGYEDKFKNLPKIYSNPGQTDQNGEGEKKYKYNQLISYVIDCMVEISIINTLMRTLVDNKEYKFSAGQASKLGF